MERKTISLDDTNELVERLYIYLQIARSDAAVQMLVDSSLYIFHAIQMFAPIPIFVGQHIWLHSVYNNMEIDVEIWWSCTNQWSWNEPYELYWNTLGLGRFISNKIRTYVLCIALY